MMTMPGEAPKRQYWIHDEGEYEYPIAVVLSERKSDGDTLVHMTDEDAKMYQEIHQLWLEAQEVLWNMEQEASLRNYASRQSSRSSGATD